MICRCKKSNHITVRADSMFWPFVVVARPVFVLVSIYAWNFLSFMLRMTSWTLNFVSLWSFNIFMHVLHDDGSTYPIIEIVRGVIQAWKEINDFHYQTQVLISWTLFVFRQVSGLTSHCCLVLCILFFCNLFISVNGFGWGVFAFSCVLASLCKGKELWLYASIFSCCGIASLAV